MGNELEYMKCQHPFIDRTSLVIVGDHVTLESGTGCVHTAPGHGVEDFVVCKNYPEIPIIVPVDAKGVLTEEAGQFAGLTTEQANKPIAEHLEKQAIFLRFKKLFTNILTAGAATSPLSSEPPLNGSALLMISRRMLFAPPRMLSGSPNGVRTGFSQWLGSAPIGAFPAKENGAFPFPCFIASIAARKLLITIL